MTRTVYLNGSYLPEDHATVSIFDRGFLMADGVYEVVSVLDGRLLDFQGHMRRLARSLGRSGEAASPNRLLKSTARQAWTAALPVARIVR